MNYELLSVILMMKTVKEKYF